VTDHVSATAGWYYSRTYNTLQVINVLRSLSDYTSFQTPNPFDPSETLTLYRLDPAKVGLVDTVATNSDVNHRDYQAFEASVTTRWARGSANFGWAMERNRTVTCDTPNPNQLRYCDQTGELFQELGAVSEIPYRHEFKAFLAQRLPYDFNVGLTLISFAGGALGVTWAVPANVFPGGRTEVVSLPLVSPGVQYLDRWTQLDISVKRLFRVKGFELQPAIEMYNLTNEAVVLGRNQTFGASLGRPLSTLQGRLLKVTLLTKF
jgi:hypothetical protein